MLGLDKGPILVTGASGGIGAATVRQLCQAGATVVASGRNEERLAALAAETGCQSLPFDLTSEDSIRGALEGRDWYGVVNCGGWGGEIAVVPWKDGLGMLFLPTDNPMEALEVLKPSGENRFRRVRRDAAHRNRLPLLFVSRRQRDLQLPRSYQRIVEKQLVKIAEPKEQECIAGLLLGGMILTHQRRRRLRGRHQERPRL